MVFEESGDGSQNASTTRDILAIVECINTEIIIDICLIICEFCSSAKIITPQSPNKI